MNKAINAIKSKRVKLIQDKLRAKEELKELFRIPYVAGRLGSEKEWQYFGDLVFTDYAMCLLSIEKYRLLHYNHPPILIMYLFFIFIGSVVLESPGWWGMAIGGGAGAIVAGIIHDQLRKRNREKIKLEIANEIKQGSRPQMDDILTFFWRETITNLEINKDKLKISWSGQKSMELKLHDGLDIDSYSRKLTDYLATGSD